MWLVVMVVEVGMVVVRQSDYCEAKERASFTAEHQSAVENARD